MHLDSQQLFIKLHTFQQN